MKPSTLLALLALGLVSVEVAAAEAPAKGKLLVASRELQGPLFAQTIILLLHYGQNGAVGLVVNRPLDLSLADALPDVSGLQRYRGTLYLGGPVAPATLRSLSRARGAPPDRTQIFNGVYLAPLDDVLRDPLPDASELRFYLGYAGWAPGQLDEEIKRGSWHVRAATEAVVFADDPGSIWQKMVPPGREYRAAASFGELLAMQ